ncbi:hypothetical protein PVL29_013247 [Vitis rotundifolia]|uniref:Uncharacterized protein n=1 Tax=Vitis rotundifolia TaxID=103349 RepID=A0AA38ZMJ5_VITRO|nr:hypothetical protein PVL29_013247 [Vitis rotundifolia]
MESTIGLRFSTLPNQYSICMPSGFHAARATKPHLSFSHSSLSLPQSSRNRPIEHIRGPITCMLDGSLPPTYYRVDKGRESMASASPFLHNIGSGRWTNHKGNAAQIDGHSLARVPLPGTTSIDHYIELMELAKKLKESRQYDLAVEILKLHEPKVSEDPEAAYQVQMEIMHILYLQEKFTEAMVYAEKLYDNKAIYAKRFQFELFYATKLLEIAKKLKESQHYDLAVKLLKVHDPEVENYPDASYSVKMEIMHMLFLQEKYEEAWTYCDTLSKKEVIYFPQFKSGLFYALKSGILCGLNRHEEAIKFMHKFNQNRTEEVPLATPEKDESTKNVGT